MLLPFGRHARILSPKFSTPIQGVPATFGPASPACCSRTTRRRNVAHATSAYCPHVAGQHVFICFSLTTVSMKIMEGCLLGGRFGVADFWNGWSFWILEMTTISSLLLAPLRMMCSLSLFLCLRVELLFSRSVVYLSYPVCVTRLIIFNHRLSFSRSGETHVVPIWALEFRDLCNCEREFSLSNNGTPRFSRK